MLSRLGITYAQGQGYVLSPDEHFEAKRAFIDGVRRRTGADGNPESEAPDSEKSGNDPTKSSSEEDSPADRLFYLDELTYELHPTTGADWSPAGEQPTAQRGTCGQRQGRLLAAMDAEGGRLFYRQKPSVGREKLTDLYREMTETYRGERLWVVQDNTPFHFHTDVLWIPTCSGIWRRKYGPGLTQRSSTLDRRSGRIRSTQRWQVGNLPYSSFPFPPMPPG
jgi:hypothetical protein